MSKRRVSPYEARNEAEQRRNGAALGTRWQENTTRPTRSRLDEGMDIWRARDAYHAQALLWVLAFMVLFFGGLALEIYVNR
jgi:hypothetical protein